MDVQTIVVPPGGGPGTLEQSMLAARVGGHVALIGTAPA
jgi:hypothetical protein